MLEWFGTNARDLPWRSPRTSPWEVLVSEVMLQQTPVARVDTTYRAWVRRWPTPGSLAQAPAAEAIRAWGRLGYPRRAVRLHAAARIIATEHGDSVPTSVDSLRTLPGVGEYTAAAVAAFAFGQRVAVLDTNVRRVLARAYAGEAAPRPHLTHAERSMAAELLPADPARAARWSAAVMELGALVCTAANPSCADCPLRGRCAWVAAGRPESLVPRRRQPFVGTDRQVRGLLMDVLRDADSPVTRSRLDQVWHDPVQRHRALSGLLEDGLAELDDQGGYRLPR